MLSTGYFEARARAPIVRSLTVPDEESELLGGKAAWQLFPPRVACQGPLVSVQELAERKASTGAAPPLMATSFDAACPGSRMCAWSDGESRS